MTANQFATAFSPFDPKNGTVHIVATAESANAPIAGGGPNNTMQIFNDSEEVAFCNWGNDNTIEAVANASYPVAPGAVVVVDVAPEVSFVAAVGGGDVYFTKGYGV